MASHADTHSNTSDTRPSTGIPARGGAGLIRHPFQLAAVVLGVVFGLGVALAYLMLADDPIFGF